MNGTLLVNMCHSIVPLILSNRSQNKFLFCDFIMNVKSLVFTLACRSSLYYLCVIQGLLYNWSVRVHLWKSPRRSCYKREEDAEGKVCRCRLYNYSWSLHISIWSGHPGKIAPSQRTNSGGSVSQCKIKDVISSFKHVSLWYIAVFTGQFHITLFNMKYHVSSSLACNPHSSFLAYFSSTSVEV